MVSVELLSPAGSWETLKAAVSEGADAIYFGAESFNARKKAENFREQEIPDVVSYCHSNGVRTHLTANTLIKNNELGGYFRLIEHAYSSGVDAVIVQDLAFIPLIKENLPGMQVHASTQAGTFNSCYSSLLEKADRVILPRELTLKQVREFHENTGIPVEVFVQGALCYSIGGQCLMSSFLGGRSGNRGLCAQPCRKRYNNSYLLSTRDLCLIKRLPEIIEAGVCSLKIEGRLRSPEYVGAATAAYRRTLDSLNAGNLRIDDNALLDLELAFSREYTEGEMFKQYDVTTPAECGKRGIRVGKISKGGAITLEAPLRVGDGVGVKATRGAHGDIIRRMERNGKEVKEAERGQTVRLQVNAKEGDEITLTSGNPRRKSYRTKERQPIVAKRTPKRVKLPRIDERGNTETMLLTKVYSLEDATKATEAGADRVYYSIFAKDYPTGNKRVGAYIPRCLGEWNAREAIRLAESAKPESVLSGDPGVATQLKGCEVYLDTSCNTFNDIDVTLYNSMDMKPVVSPELSLQELKEFKDKRFAVYAHGRIPLMTTRYRLREETLKDEKGYMFPTRRELDCRQILNSVPHGLYNEVLTLKRIGIMEYLLDLEKNAGETVQTYRRILAGEKMRKLEGEHTLGHYRRGVE